MYKPVIEDIFLARYKQGATEISFTMDDIVKTAAKLKVDVGNRADISYNFRNRSVTPQLISKTAPSGFEWIIRGAGKGKYNFALVPETLALKPTPGFAETKIPNATPNIISQYALTDEQALLAMVRCNRLVDIFTGLTCYSLQNHLRTSIKSGQIEVDELYIGIDKRGVHYILPVEAKGKKEKLGRVQIEQNFALCREKFPNLKCKLIATQFMPNDVIVLSELEINNDDLSKVAEKHYRLVRHDELSSEELEIYKTRSD